MGALVTKTGLHFELELIRNEVLALLTEYNQNQLNLTALDPDETSYLKSAGSLYNVDRTHRLHSEQDFRYFILPERTPNLFMCYQRLQREVPERLGRVRILMLDPKKCYSLHKDDNVRYHLAIVTNTESFLAFESGLYHVPSDGYVYRADTRYRHTAMNCGNTPRVHIVFSTESKEIIYENK